MKSRSIGNNYMKTNFSKLIVLFILSFFTISNCIVFSQSNIKKGFKFGLELKDYLTENTGSFNKSFGFTFGGFTAIKLYSFSKSDLLLRTEFNFVKLQYHNPGNKIYTTIDTLDVNWNERDYVVNDEKFMFKIIELGLIPEYQIQLNEKTFLEFFLGPSIGIGMADFDTKQLDHNHLTTGIYEDFEMMLVYPTSLNFGVSLYYNQMVFDVRYRYTKLNNYSRKPDFTNVYAQIGITL